MMTTVRLHSYTTDTGHEPATGVGSADFRGDGFKGKAQGDEHHTLLEVDVDDASPIVAEVLRDAPLANRLFRSLYEANVAHAGSLGGVVPCLRIGVWSKKAEDGS